MRLLSRAGVIGLLITVGLVAVDQFGTEAGRAVASDRDPFCGPRPANAVSRDEEKTLVNLQQLQDELSALKARVATLEGGARPIRVYAFGSEFTGDQRDAIIRLGGLFHAKYKIEFVERRSNLYMRGDPAAMEVIVEATRFMAGAVPAKAQLPRAQPPTVDRNPFE